MITEEQRDRVERECATRRMVAGTGDESEGTASLMSAVGLGLTGRLTAERNSCVSDVVREMVIGLHDSLPDDVRSGQAWRSLGPMMLGTGGDGHDRERVRMILGWVRGSVLSDDAATYAAYAAATAAAYAAAYAYASDTATATAYAYAYAYAYARAYADAARRDARVASATAYADATATASADATAYAARKEFWRRADPAGLVRQICGIGR